MWNPNRPCIKTGHDQFLPCYSQFIFTYALLTHYMNWVHAFVKALLITIRKKKWTSPPAHQKLRNSGRYTTKSPQELRQVALIRSILTFWRRIFLQILAHSVFKMWVIRKPNNVALWNKRHFEEKKWRLYSMFKIFSTDICWINIKWGI